MVEKRLGQQRGVERVASWPRSQPRQARSAQCVRCGRSAGSPRDEARAGRAPRDQKETVTTLRSRSRQPGAVSVEKRLGQRRGVKSRVGRADNRAKLPTRSAYVVGGWLVLHGATRTCAARHGTRKRRLRRFEAITADPARCRWRCVSANDVALCATRIGRADNRAKHAARSACLVGGGCLSTGRCARALRATGLEKGGYDGSKPQPPTRRGGGGEESRPTAWGGALRELAAQTTAPSTQRAVRALWAIGCFSTGRRARRPRATGLERDGYDASKP